MLMFHGFRHWTLLRDLAARDLAACTAQVAPFRNVRHLGAGMGHEDTGSCLAPGLFAAVSALVVASQVKMGGPHPACAQVPDVRSPMLLGPYILPRSQTLT